MPKYVVVESVRSVGVARMGLLWLPLVHFLGSVLSGVFYCFLHEPPLNQYRRALYETPKIERASVWLFCSSGKPGRSCR